MGARNERSGGQSRNEPWEAPARVLFLALYAKARKRKPEEVNVALPPLGFWAPSVESLTFTVSYLYQPNKQLTEKAKPL